MWQYETYNELYHHGIKGQKWGVRRYQNPDGTLTAEGRIRYGKDADYVERTGKTINRVQKVAKTVSKVTNSVIGVAGSTYGVIGGVSAATAFSNPLTAIPYASLAIAYAGGSALHHAINKWIINKVADSYLNALDKDYAKDGKEYIDTINKQQQKKTIAEQSDFTRKLGRSKADMMKTAKNEGKWDIDFLETIQNTKIFDDQDINAMLKEYEQWIDDPSEYNTHRLNKLKMA